MKKINSDKDLIIGVNNYVQHSMAILDRVHELIDKKFGGKQIELAKKLGKKESQVSKWLNGVQNFTLFTIAELEEAFEEPIIAVCTNKDESTFVQVHFGGCINHTVLEIDETGIEEKERKYKSVDFALDKDSFKDKIILS